MHLSFGRLVGILLLFFSSSICMADAQGPKMVLAPYAAGGFEAGMTLYVNKSDYSGKADLLAKLSPILDTLVDDHVNALSVVWPFYTGTVTSNSVFKGEGTPSDEDLKLIAKAAMERGFIVTLRPILDEHSLTDAQLDWRGTIKPTNVKYWFGSYAELVLGYARLAQEIKVHAFIIGAELDSMEQYADQWSRLIYGVRKAFHGIVSYSSNQGVSETMPWKKLDYVGVDGFFPLSTPDTGATDKDMQESEETWVEWIKNATAGLDKPVMLTEVGSESEQNAHKQSWVWDHGTQVDLEDQGNFYKSVCAAWKPFVKGIYWWAITLKAPADPKSDGSFTPIAKPAEEVMKQCYSQ